MLYNSQEGLIRSARTVFSHGQEDFRFSRAREIVDPKCTLLHFPHDGQYWFLKVPASGDALREFENTHRAASLIDGTEVEGSTIWVAPQVVCPLPDSLTGLISRDLGPTLFSSLPSPGLQDTLTAILQRLHAMGIDWKGFAPRNIVYDETESQFHLIDLDDTLFHDSLFPVVRRCSKLKWRLNWEQIWPQMGSLSAAIDAIPARKVPDLAELDDFERTLVDLAGPQPALGPLIDRSDTATLLAERPFISADGPDPTPFAMGHLLDELFPRRVSVFLTFLFAQIRQDDPSGFAILITDLDETIGTQRGERSRPHLSAVLLRILAAVPSEFAGTQGFDATALSGDLQTLANSSGLDAALDRSRIAESIINGLALTLCYAFPFLARPQVILRGSVGQGIMTRFSDMDFELSSETHPHGRPPLEALLCDLLACFGLAAEGSDQRPTELDLTGMGGHHRDANEWSQLRHPLTRGGRPDWLRALFPDADRSWWRRLSLYERDRPVSAKRNGAYLFKATRSTVARLAARNGCVSSHILTQLATIDKTTPPNTAAHIRSLLVSSVLAREGAISDPASIDRLCHDVSDSCRTWSLADPFAGGTIPDRGKAYRAEAKSVSGMSSIQRSAELAEFSKLLDCIFLEATHAEPWSFPDAPPSAALDFVLAGMATLSPEVETHVRRVARRIDIRIDGSLENKACVARCENRFVVTICPTVTWRHIVLLAHEVAHILHMDSDSFADGGDVWSEVVAFLGELAFVENLHRSGIASENNIRGLTRLFDALYIGSYNRALGLALNGGDAAYPDCYYPLARCCAKELGTPGFPAQFSNALTSAPLAMNDIVALALSHTKGWRTRIQAHADPNSRLQTLGLQVFDALSSSTSHSDVAEACERLFGPDARKYHDARGNEDNVAPIQPGEVFAWRRVFCELPRSLACLARSSYHRNLEFQKFFRLEVLPPLVLRQVYFHPSANIASGFLSWAWLSDAALGNILETTRVVGPQEWRSGKNLFFNDIYVEPGATAAFFKHVRKMPLVANADCAYAISRNADGSPRLIRRLPLEKF